MSTTSPERRAQAGSRGERGFAIIAALFILVVLAGLGAYVALVSSMQATGSASDVTGARVYQAARAGTEWGLCKAVGTAVQAPTCNPNSCTGGAGVNLTINGVAVTVTCTAVASGSAVEAGLGTIYSITAVACNAPAGGTCPGAAATPNYVERSLNVLVER